MGDGKRSDRLLAWVSALSIGTGSQLATATPETPPALPEEVEQEAPSEPAPNASRRPADDAALPEAPEEPPDGPSDDELAVDPYPPPLGSSGTRRLRAQHPGPFARGGLRLSVVLGGGTDFDDDYLILGGGIGYYLLDGLELSAQGAAWLVGDPFLATVSPGLTYAFIMVPQAHPYLGVFYRHYFIGDGFDDLDTYGARGGVYLTVGQRGFVGAGVVYERRFDCDEDVLWRDCNQWYPELTVAFVF